MNTQVKNRSMKFVGGEVTKYKNAKTEPLISSNKLRSAIDNFDKILNEHKVVSAKAESKIPKLVKAKTCIIIESKCILKKTNSHPLSQSKSNVTLNKTKSLNSLDKDEAFGSQQTKVKELVRRLNSLNDEKEKNVDCKLSKTLSVSDLNATKNRNCSKIPVNRNLRKSFPSTPCDLNNLDRVSGSAKQLQSSRFNKSTHNLNIPSPKFSLAKATNKVLVTRKSTQDLSIKRDFVNKNTPSPKLIVKIKTTTSDKKSKSPIEIKELLDTKSITRDNAERRSTSNLTVAKSLLNKVEILSSKIKPVETVVTKDRLITTKASKENCHVKAVIEKLEDSSEKTKAAKLDYAKNYKTFIRKHTNNNDMIGERKSFYEPKIVNNANNNKQNINKLTYKKPKTPNNQQPNAEILKKSDVEKLNYVNYEEVKAEKIYNYLDKEGQIKKDLDYNSDDSGNISNEIEGDCEESSTSARSRTCTESSDNKQAKNVDAKVLKKLCCVNRKKKLMSLFCILRMDYFTKI